MGARSFSLSCYMPLMCALFSSRGFTARWSFAGRSPLFTKACHKKTWEPRVFREQSGRDVREKPLVPWPVFKRLKLSRCSDICSTRIASGEGEGGGKVFLTYFGGRLFLKHLRLFHRFQRKSPPPPPPAHHDTTSSCVEFSQRDFKNIIS